MKEKNKQGLLFYLSGDELTADYAKGRATPTFCKDVKRIADGVNGGALECGNAQQLAYRAPHNIYSARGTLGFFWRSRYEVGPTEFPLFRVSFADHSSWDACWLRVDYNGHGFDGMITDINLAKARVRTTMTPFPGKNQWTHLALAWDESFGIRFYINGRLAGEEYRPGIYSTGLDQFGPHSRIISNWNVSSDYNFIRGGDIDEVVIYDRMLTDVQILTLAEGELPVLAPEASPLPPAGRAVWQDKNGLYPDVPVIPDEAVVKKVEIHEAYDLKRWWWKACDGIRETTWPGVYNRSRLKDRHDYFQLPDWDCYSASGKQIRFYLPDESFNHIEIAGSARGIITYKAAEDKTGSPLVSRRENKDRTSHRLPDLQGGILEFTNDEIEEPLGDFSLYHVVAGKAPKGVYSQQYILKRWSNSGSTRPRQELGSLSPAGEKDPLKDLADFISGRYLPTERRIFQAIPHTGTGKEKRPGTGSKENPFAMPLFHFMIPYESPAEFGLDGIEIELDVSPDEDFTCAVEVRDPAWYYRNLAHFTFRAETGHKKTLWLDLRDRMLPADKCLYMTLAFDVNITTGNIEQGVSIRCVYKTAAEAKKEHVADRLIQVKDLYGHLVEEYPGNEELNMYNRFIGDMEDVFRLAPDHPLVGRYQYERRLLDERYGKENTYIPSLERPVKPADIPDWAFWQTEYLKRYKYLIEWYIDNRQIENGEFGGGLSDDGDFTSQWVGLIAMGCNREKVLTSLKRNLEAFYDQGMFTNGLCSIQADELHSAEEGLISLCQYLTGDFSHPLMLERAMETARSLDWLTGINEAGHRHIKSCYYNGSKMATEDPWGCQQPYSTIAISPAWLVLRFNGNEKLRRLLTELADGLAAHYDEEQQQLNSYIRFIDDKELEPYKVSASDERSLLYPAYAITGNKFYYDILPKRCKIFDNIDVMNHYPYKGNKLDFAAIARNYEALHLHYSIREYYNTEGHPWIDRVYFDSDWLQYDRVGGIAHIRNRFLYPCNRIQWRFNASGDDEQLAILMPVAKEDEMELIIFNLADEEITCKMVGCEVLPGIWKLQQLDEKGIVSTAFTAPFERSAELPLCFPAKKEMTLRLKRIEAGVPYYNRCDLGISKEDIRFYPHGMNVRVHSLGSQPSPEVKVVLKNQRGRILKEALLPPLEAPVDLWPRYRDVIFTIYDIPSLKGCYVEIDPEHQLQEITRENNIVYLS